MNNYNISKPQIASKNSSRPGPKRKNNEPDFKSYDKLVNFAKFLNFKFQEGCFYNGQIYNNGRFVSQIGINSMNEVINKEESLCRDLAHEIAHYLIANKYDYKLKNFGLALPGEWSRSDDCEIDEKSCVLGCIILNQFNINNDYIYRELMNDEFTSQEMIDVNIQRLIESDNLKSDFVKTLIKRPKLNILKRKDNLPKYLILPKFFNIPHKILRRSIPKAA